MVEKKKVLDTWTKLVGYHSQEDTFHAYSNDSILDLYGGPDSSPKGARPYGVIQLKKHMDESFCIGTIIHWGAQKYQ